MDKEKLTEYLVSYINKYKTLKKQNELLTDELNALKLNIKKPTDNEINKIVAEEITGTKGGGTIDIIKRKPATANNNSINSDKKIEESEGISIPEAVIHQTQQKVQGGGQRIIKKLANKQSNIINLSKYFPDL